MNQAQAIMEKQVEAYNERNMEKFLSCFTDDIEFFNLHDSQRVLNGKENVREDFTKLFESSPKLNLVIKSRIVCGNYVTDHEIVHGAARYPNGIEVVSINEIQNGLIRKIWFTPTIIY